MPAMEIGAWPTIRRPSRKDSRRADQPGARGHDERRPATQQQAEDHHRDGRRLEADQETVVRPVAVGPGQRPDGSGERDDHDQRIQATGGQNGSQPAHDATVTSATARRVLTK